MISPMSEPPTQMADERSTESSLPSNGGTQTFSEFKINDDRSVVCLPYKYQTIQHELDNAAADKTDHNNVIAKLCEMGIKCYLVMHDSIDIHDDLSQVVEAASNDDRKTSDHKRCCLYKDEHGRIYNIVISGGSSGLASSWKSLLISFSGFEATAALLVLCRTFACPLEENVGLRPLYLALILGVVLSEEISDSWLTTSMFVRGTPSIGAYTLSSYFTSDWPRKLLVFSLSMAAATVGLSGQKYIALFGICWACCILAVNLGSRAWRNLHLKTLEYSGFGASIVAWTMAFFAGICFPYLGFREVAMGGQVALEHTLISALFCAIIFIVSDIDMVQEYILVGSRQCNQDAVNVIVGSWFVLSLLASIWFYTFIRPQIEEDDETDHYLVEDQTSPVGFIVPNIPSFNVDPSLSTKPSGLCKETVVKILGALLAVVVGGFIIAIGLFYDELKDATCNGTSLC